MFVGPGGLERRTDVWIGVPLLAPEVRYPDHTHPPEETYLVLSAGQFRQEDGPWFEPGIGGSFYNPPGIVHAMRSNSEPLFAFWTLRDKRTGPTACRSMSNPRRLVGCEMLSFRTKDWLRIRVLGRKSEILDPRRFNEPEGTVFQPTKVLIYWSE